MPTMQAIRAMNISSSSRTEENALGLLLMRRLMAVRTNSPFFFHRPRKMPRAMAWLRPMLAIEAMIVSYQEQGTRFRYSTMPNTALLTMKPRIGMRNNSIGRVKYFGQPTMPTVQAIAIM